MFAGHDKLAIGVDLGGTNIRAALVTRDGEILSRRHIATPTENGHLAPPGILVEAICECADPLRNQGNVIGVGVGSGGQFNPHTGVMLGVHTDHPEFINVPMAAMLADRLSSPVFVDNDVKAAAYAEVKCGGGQAYQQLICVAVGTFIGGALVVDGRLVHGSSGLAGHIGQLMDFQRGQYIEDIAGGVPMGKRAIQQGILAEDQTTEDLFHMARAGHRAALQFIQQTGKTLGIALAGLAHFIQPEVILVGGSVGVQPEYLDAVNSGLAENLMANWQSVRAVPMTLGTDAAQIGAALRVFDELA
jgi:glucokinase